MTIMIIFFAIVLIFIGVYSNDECEQSTIKLTLNSSEFILIPKILRPFTSYYQIDASNIQLKQIPDFKFANISVCQLILSSNQIETISKRSFSGLAYIYQLNLRQNGIESIETLISGWDTNTLSFLDLANNMIRRIDTKFSPYFSNLFNLVLEYNQIEFVADYAFENLIYLKRIYFSGNRLKVIGNFMLSNLRNLTLLNMNYNLIERIEPDAFKDLETLRSLMLNKNFIESIDISFSYLTELFELYINFNKIVKIQTEAVSKMTNLFILDLRNNLLNEQSSASLLSNINYLSLSRNLISSLSKSSFSGSSSLSNLLLFQCKISHIGAQTFENQTSLSSLNLDYNKLSVIENGIFEGLLSLTQLSIESNIISFIEPQAFRPLEKLKILNLKNNLLTNASPDLFHNLNSLQQVILSYNQIKSIDSYFVRDLPNLYALLLNNNLIESIAENSFKNLTQLGILDLSINKLRAIKAYYFIGLFSLIRLNLNANGINSIESGSFRDLVNIEEINLSENFLISIDRTAFQYSNCLLVDLSNSQLDYIDFNIFYDSNIQKVNLEKNLLKSIDKGELYYLAVSIELNFGFNYLKSLSSELFGNQSSNTEIFHLNNNLLDDLSFLSEGSQLINLVELDISFNRIEYIFKRDFKSLINLKILNIGNNRIKFIDDEVFNILTLSSINLINVSFELNVSLNNLERIDMSRNIVSDLILSNSTNLRELILRNTTLKLSRLNFSSMAYLTKLDLSDNNDDGNFIFDKLLRLETLILSNMMLSSTKRFNINNFRNLSYLNLSCNKISTIEKSDFSELKSLEVLDLRFNEISSIEENSFVGLVRLRYVNLSRNRIRLFLIDDSLSIIEELYLAENADLEEIRVKIENEQIGIFKEAKIVDISKNSFKFTPFLSLVNKDNKLVTFYLNGNRLTHITNDMFVNMKLLSELNLNSNQISLIEFSSFWDLDMLVSLELANNSLTRLDDQLFVNLLQLKYLNLNSNKIEFISPVLFSQLINLEHLDLSFNQLKSIDDFSFLSLSFLQNINIDGNIHLNFSSYSFYGLSSLKNLFISYQSLTIERNKNILLDSLIPKKEKTVDELIYFKSINIISENDLIDCLLVLDFLKKNIQVNLRTDYEMLLFLSSCQYIDLFNS